MWLVAITCILLLDCVKKILFLQCMNGKICL